jgi:hypothetical protein
MLNLPVSALRVAFIALRKPANRMAGDLWYSLRVDFVGGPSYWLTLFYPSASVT